MAFWHTVVSKHSGAVGVLSLDGPDPNNAQITLDQARDTENGYPDGCFKSLLPFGLQEEVLKIECRPHKQVILKSNKVI